MEKEQKIELTTISELRSKVQEIYNTIPKFDSFDCKKACENKSCKFECCTVSGCTIVEGVLINKHIKSNKLDLPLITAEGHIGYVLPNSNNVTDPKTLYKGKEGFKQVTTSKCLYLGENGCKIYDQRPIISRLFGLTELMPCSHIKKQKLLDIKTTYINYLKPLADIIPHNAKVSII